MNNKIKEILEKKGIKKSFVIQTTGLSKSAFYEIMNGNAIPSLANARLISDAVGVPLNELFPEENMISKGE